MPMRQITLTFEVEEELAEQLENSGLMADPSLWLKNRIAASEKIAEYVRYIVSECGNPQTVNKGYIAFLLRELVGPLTPQQKNFLAIIEENNALFWNILVNYRDLADFESGKQVVMFAPVFMTELLNKAFQSLQTKFRFKNQEQRIISNVLDKLPIISGDEYRLLRVLDSLLEEISILTPAKGIIEISADPNQDSIHIQINGNGFEISETIQQHFFSMPATIVARHIVNAHKGKIWIESELGKGTTVHVTLPIHHEGSVSERT